MLCPKCNSTIKDGYVLCDKCGYDIQMVPDFDAVIEDQIDKTLSAMLEGLNLEDLTEEEVEKLSHTLDLEATRDLKKRIELAKTRDLKNSADAVKTSKGHKNSFSTIIAIFALLLMVCLGIFMYLSAKDSPEGLSQQAVEAEERNDFEAAVSLYQRALDKNPNYEDAAFGLAYNLMMCGKNEESIEILKKLTSGSNSKRAYLELIALYESMNDYNAITYLLNECSDNSIREKYSRYIIEEPQFEVDEGIYEDSVTVKLTTNVSGHIYYTLDGSEPDENSLEYTAPFEITKGKVVVRAVFINSIGIQSDSVSRIYEIESSLPASPVVTPDSGIYTSADYIECKFDEGLRVYYTTDGTIPSDSSEEYTKPLLMKEGDMTFKFIAVNDKGKHSDVVSMSYSLEISARCLESDAINYVTASLTATGKLENMSGAAADGSGIYKYSCDGVVSFEGDNYYIVSELLEAAGVESGIKNYYGVDSVTGSLKHAVIDKNGYFELEDF